MPVARLRDAFRSRLGERGGIVHSVGTLVGGTAFAQALVVLALPVLTRLYTPAEFSVLAVYAAVLGILTVVACLRLEIAIPLPERDEDAASLLVLSLAIGSGVALLCGIAVLVFGARLAEWLYVPTLAIHLWLVPLGVFLASAYAAFQYWSTRKKRFRRIARTRISQALGGVGVQLGAGAAGLGPFGLLLGHAVSGGAGFWGLGRDAWRNDWSMISSVTFASMRNVLCRYSHFPKYSTWEALGNAAGTQLPIILIAAWAAGPEAGYLMLAMRLMGAPMGLVGGSIAQVYLAHAPEELRAGRLGDFTAKILSGLLKTGVGPLLFVGIVAAPVAGIVFGEQWQRTGELLAWMTPWFVLQLLSSPVSMVMHVKERQRLMTGLQVAGLVVRLAPIWLAYEVATGLMAESYAVAGALFYAACCVVYYRTAGIRLVHLAEAAVGALRHIAPWLVGALVLRLAISITLAP